jgi:hypothetical protein
MQSLRRSRNFNPDRSLCCGHRLSPAPLQKALEAVQSLGRDERLILHTRFRPVHFFERIDEATTDYDCEEVGPNHWVTTLWRISA